MLAVIRTTENGKVKETIMYDGSYIKEKGGTALLTAQDCTEYLSCKSQGNTAELFASSDVKTAGITVYTEDNIKNVLYNGKSVEFDLDGKTLKLTGKDSEEVLENDPGSGKGGVRGNESPGGSGGGNNGSNNGGNNSGNNGGNNRGNTDNSVIFTDIKGHWAEDSIIRMAKAGIVKGYGTIFIPDGNITRAELVTMVVRVLNLDTTATDTGFEDVPADSWFAPYIKAALDKGIIAKDTVFRPNDNITREEMSKILSLTNTLLTDTEMTTPDDFTTDYIDENDISDWAKPYAAYASYSALMKGMDDGRFAPKETATRAQATTVLDRILK